MSLFQAQFFIPITPCAERILRLLVFVGLYLLRNRCSCCVVPYVSVVFLLTSDVWFIRVS